MADCKRKTANLFDGTKIEAGRINSETGIVEYASGTSALSFADETVTISTSVAWRGFVTDFISTQEYLKWSYVSDTIMHGYEFAYDENKEFLGAVFLSVVPTGTKYIRISFQFETTVTNAKIKNIMLNTGSTPLPYEPYGWLHSLRKLTTATDTLTSLPADVYTDGTNAIVGLVGNMSQTGTPTPSSPIQPQETGDRAGNLFDKDSVMVGGIDADGSIAPNDNMRVSDYIRVNPNTVYAATYLTIAYYGRTIAYYDTNKNLISTASNNVQSEDGTATYTITTPNNCYYVRIATYVRVTNHVDDIMFNLGTTPLPYEPYGYVLPIKSANTTTPVYLGEVQTTRKIKKYEITGLEGWILRSGTPENEFFCERQGTNFVNNAAICSHYPNQDSGSFADLQDKHFLIRVASSNDKTYLTIRDSSYPSTNEGVEQLRSYLQQQYSAGTPVTIWYVLATETTGIVNEPLRKIGTYADTVSGITIPTITGADTFDVETTLKPSEVSLAYTGWHDATVKEWDGSQWQ